MRPKLKELRFKVEKEIKQAEAVVQKNQKSANLIGGGIASGYSIAGDLEHARNTSFLSEKRLVELRKLEQELAVALRRPVTAVVPPCFLAVRDQGGQTKEFYLVKNPVHFAKVNLVSVNSSLGKALQNRRSGENFTYLSADGVKITHEIIRIA